ncbi:uncharacterized protein BXIN_3015 [Babesia sp. Xinjiang]|uniref:uncharacterized protein n=1 Tax=Babesia sp. Xinjiang TaxID=462227 RepID=UPI000A254B95|nr:uncharacterized protein BXIN_3015 [Babesia sp. Xinjiang]ORM39364.1 hypothetical protein BXIN_3015 [Babesia sp. Xinjiang]
MLLFAASWKCAQLRLSCMTLLISIASLNSTVDAHFIRKSHRLSNSVAAIIPASKTHNNQTHASHPVILASIPSSQDKSKPGNNSARSNCEVGGSVESGLRYFSDLLNAELEDFASQQFADYASKCEQARLAVTRAFARLIKRYVDLADNKPHNTNPSAPEHSSDINSNNGRLLDTAFVAAIARYIALTMTGLPARRTWFSYRGTMELRDEDQLVRLNQLVALMLSVEALMYDAFREFIASHKLVFVSKMFASGRHALLKLTEKTFVKKLQRDFETAANTLLPKSYNISQSPDKVVRELLQHVVKVDPSLSDALAPLKSQKPDAELSNKLSKCIRKWNIKKDVDEFSALLTNLSNTARASIKQQLEDSAKKDKLLEMLSAQQQQIDIYEKQLAMQSQNQSPLSYGFSYRMPNTNLNILGSFQRYVSTM